MIPTAKKILVDLVHSAQTAYNSLVSRPKL
jgi:hypothetical protein